MPLCNQLTLFPLPNQHCLICISITQKNYAVFWSSEKVCCIILKKHKQFYNKCIFFFYYYVKHGVWLLVHGLASSLFSLTLFLSLTTSHIIEKNDDMSFKSTSYISEIRCILAIKYYLKKSHKLKEEHRLLVASGLFLREQLPLYWVVKFIIKIFQLLLLGELQENL